MKLIGIGMALVCAAAIVSPVAATVYVKPGGSDKLSGWSWSEAKGTLQAAIDLAASYGGDQVCIMTGTYVGRFTLKHGVQLTGGYSGYDWERDTNAYPTVLDGGRAGTVIKVAPNSWVSIDGVEINNGRSTNGGGIYCSNSTLTVTNCEFTGNYATRNGGAIYTAQSGTTITYCRFNSNIAASYGGGVSAYSGYITMKRNTFSKNRAYGGGAFDCEHVFWSVSQFNEITSNRASVGGGISIRAQSEMPVLNCVLSGNTAEYGGGIYYNASSSLQASNLIKRNSATSSGGGVCWVSKSFIDSVNDTIADNSASMGGGTCALTGSNGWLANNILYSNTARQGGAAYKDKISSLDMINCCYYINGGTPLYGGVVADPDRNIIADPMFVDHAGDNYHILPYSPCVDAGSDYFVMYHDEWRDLDEWPRMYGTVDIGCYEVWY